MTDNTPRAGVAGFTFDRRVTTGNLISIAVYVVAMIVAGVMLNARVASAEGAIGNLQLWESATNATVASSDTRLTTLEVKGQAAADRGAQTQATLKDIQQTMTVLLQQTAAINAKLESRSAPP